jgi:hypothetical protein
MYPYSAYGLCIHSELELPGLPEGGGRPDVIFRFGAVDSTEPRTTIGQEIAHHAKGGWFLISEGREIVMHPPQDVDPDLLCVLLLGRMMAFLLRQRGWLPLHASGVNIDGRAVLFLGSSGAGKSTLAAAFHARGHQLITDDVAAVRIVSDQCIVLPAGPRVRLLKDASSVFAGSNPEDTFQWRKHLFHLAGPALPDWLEVSRIYLLSWGERIGGEIIPPMRAAAELSRNSVVRHRRMDIAALAAHLQAIAAVTLSVPFGRLYRPRSMDSLAALIRWVEADSGSQTATASKRHPK